MTKTKVSNMLNMGIDSQLKQGVDTRVLTVDAHRSCRPADFHALAPSPAPARARGRVL